MMMSFVVTLFLLWMCCSPDGVHGARANEDAIMYGINFKVYAYEVIRV